MIVGVNVTIIEAFPEPVRDLYVNRVLNCEGMRKSSRLTAGCSGAMAARESRYDQHGTGSRADDGGDFGLHSSDHL